MEPVAVFSRTETLHAPLAMKPGDVTLPRIFALPIEKCPRPVTTRRVPVSGLPGLTCQVPCPWPVR